MTVTRKRLQALDFARSVCDATADGLENSLVYWVDGSFVWPLAGTGGESTSSSARAGAGVVLSKPCTGEPQIFETFALGGSYESRDSELYAIQSALGGAALETSAHCWALAMVFSDCIDAIHLATGAVASRLCASIRSQLRKLRKLGCTLESHWVPGHERIPGNEYADRLARLVCHLAGRMDGPSEGDVRVRQVPVMLMQLAVSLPDPRFLDANAYVRQKDQNPVQKMAFPTWAEGVDWDGRIVPRPKGYETAAVTQLDLPPHVRAPFDKGNAQAMQYLASRALEENAKIGELADTP